MIYYYLLTHRRLSNLVTPTEDEWQIAADIREGQINSFLTKPMSYLAYRLQHFFERPSRLHMRSRCRPSSLILLLFSRLYRPAVRTR